MTERWKHHICGWFINGRSNPLHVVKFEDLKSNTLIEVWKIISFFGGEEYLNITTETLGYDNFYRNHTDMFDHFTPDQEKYISEAILTTMVTLAEHYGKLSRIMTILHSYVRT